MMVSCPAYSLWVWVTPSWSSNEKVGALRPIFNIQYYYYAFSIAKSSFVLVDSLVPVVYSLPMQKLLSLNTEGNRHTDRILALIDVESPDIISLYEAPTEYLHLLSTRGYFTTFAPMCTDNPVAPNDTIGILVATKLPHTSTTHYYTSKYGEIHPHDKHDAHSKSYPCITTTVTVDGVPITIASVHLYDTWNGHESDEQTTSVEALLAYLETKPPHVLCGDFNMPRGYNTNYERFTEHYRDEIPAHYTSSLDKALRRAGARTDLNAPIFDIYMVAYVFSQAPYQVSAVELHFGVSDHAAVTATIATSK